jgi:hypothetical protein
MDEPKRTDDEKARERDDEQTVEDIEVPEKHAEEAKGGERRREPDPLMVRGPRR